jgi:hypothetical protein
LDIGHPAAVLFGLALLASPSRAGENLLVNGDFTAPNPLEGWRTTIPGNEWYAKNQDYVRVVQDPVEGKPAVLIDAPAGIAGMQGVKIESALYPFATGAVYRASAEFMTWDLEAKFFVEVWFRDPMPDVQAKSNVRIPAGDGHPALLMCYRKQVQPTPPGRSRKWTRVEDVTKPQGATTVTLKLPGAEEATEQPRTPEWISVKAYFYQGTMGATKGYVRNFRLEKVD